MTICNNILAAFMSGKTTVIEDKQVIDKIANDNTFSDLLNVLDDVDSVDEMNELRNEFNESIDDIPNFNDYNINIK